MGLKSALRNLARPQVPAAGCAAPAREGIVSGACLPQSKVAAREVSIVWLRREGAAPVGGLRHL